MNIRPALNSDQAKVLQQTEGPVLVIAVRVQEKPRC